MKKVSWDALPEPSKLLLSRKRYRDRNKSIKLSDNLVEMLQRLSVKNLRVIAKKHNIKLGVRRKKNIIEKISNFLLNEDTMKNILQEVTEEAKELFFEIVVANGYLEYSFVINEYGNEEKDSPYWFLMRPASVLGNLRSAGLVFVGETYTNNWLKIIVCIPSDLLIIVNKIIE